MPIKIYHTADLHLGMKFTRGYESDIQERLIQARYDTLQRMVSAASERRSDLFVIAGDLFDSQYVPKKDVLKAAGILRKFEGRLLLVLPGNHDFLQRGETGIWDWFGEAMGDHALLLDKPATHDLRRWDLDVAIYAAPCATKHSGTNAIGWIRDYPKDPEVKFHIGVAHGSLEELSPDFDQNYYPMNEGELRSADLDLWLMGHTHIRYPDQETGTEARIFFPSTPEPDGFDCPHPGYAWGIALADDKSLSYRILQTGSFRFHTLEKELFGEGDLEALKDQFRKLDSRKDLVKLKLKGRIPGVLFDERKAFLEGLAKNVLYLEDDVSELYRQITLDDIDREFTEGSFPHRLLRALAQDRENPLALQMAYDLIREVKTCSSTN